MAALRHYRRADLRYDVVAGLTLSALLVPAGMGYAEVAGLPPVTGLYATVAALGAYAVFGPSRTLILGPDSSLAPVIGAAIAPLALADTDRAVSLAGLLAVMVGVALILGGLLRFGFITDLVSKPIRIGYLNGIAAVVVVNQLPKLVGFSIDGGAVDAQIRGLIDGVREGEASGAAALIGGCALVGILVLRELVPRVPWLLVAVVASAVVVVAVDPAGVAVIGSLPGGLPAPSLGQVTLGDVFDLMPAAAGLAIVAFGDSSVLSRTFAMADGHDVDKDKEMAAVGAANIACGALGGFPVAASSSRTPVARESGARTQLTGVIGALLVVLLLVFAPEMTRNVPSAALAAVVIAAVVRVADLPGLVRLWSMSRTEGWVGIASFAGVVVFGVLEGIGIAVVLSLGAFVARAWRPHAAELVRVDGRKGYHDRTRHPSGRRVPGMIIVRFDAPLFFANTSFFEQVVREAVEAAPPPVRWVVVAGDAITDVDTTGAEALALLDDELTAQGITMVFAGLKGTVRDRLARYGMAERFGPDRQFSTLGVAVSTYVRTTGVEWIDWTDR
ncbi:MAG: SulP family inorganic anion transporter [Acidimicrobiales bacterium]